jgi:beta-lactamase regulating signal transducer with metallopeptidase domain
MIASMNPAIHAAAHLVTLRVLQSLVEGSLVAVFASLVLARTRYNSSTRFGVWFSSLIAVAAVPVIAGQWLWSEQSAIGRPAVTVPDSWALYFFGAWAAIAGWLLLGVGRSLVHLRTIRKSCEQIDTAALDPAICETLERHRGRRHVVLCTSTKVRVPTALGLINPAIVIPGWLMQELSPLELNQVLLHELAHLRRWDDWTNLAQQLIKAIFFFHPAVWWIERKVALEREMACDDAVLAETSSPRIYAECLARLAEKSFVHRSVVLAQAALGRIRETTIRVARILDPQRSSGPSRSLVPAVFLIALFAIGCGLWSARTSRLIGFGSDTPAQIISPAVYHETEASAGDFGAKAVPAIARSSEMPRVTPARLGLGTATRRHVSERTRPRPLVHPVARTEQMIHSASAKTAAVPVTQTIFVVIENHEPDLTSGYAACRIQMWRLTVFHALVDPGNDQIPHKQI